MAKISVISRLAGCARFLPVVNLTRMSYADENIWKRRSPPPTPSSHQGDSVGSVGSVELSEVDEGCHEPPAEPEAELPVLPAPVPSRAKRARNTKLRCAGPTSRYQSTPMGRGDPQEGLLPSPGQKTVLITCF